MRKLNALIVDGTASFRTLAQELLEKTGFIVEVAETGQEGLERAEQGKFTLVCCSYALPDMTGSNFCGQVRALSGYDFSSVLMLVSADDNNPQTFKQAFLAGATDMFDKDDLTELETYLQRFVERESRQLSGRVLFIEDSRVSQEIIIDLLVDMGLDVDSYTHGEGAWEAYQDGHYELVITDIMLEGSMSGISLVRKIRRLRGDQGNTPIIATSGFDNVSRKIELFQLGINDYIAKPIIFEELRQRVFNNIISYQTILELRAQQNSLYSLSMLDELTQLFNRHALREFAGKYFSEALRYNRPLTLAVVNIDYFKDINETHGHATGDKILAELGVWLKRFVREEDMVARWSGDEFIFLLPNCGSATGKSLMERLQKRLAQFRPANVDITVSIGIVTMTGEIKYNLNSLAELADTAMYQAKMAGRNCIRVYEDDVEAETSTS